MSVVNALAYGVGAKISLDQTSIALPASGHASQVSLTPGSHRVQLSSISGLSLIDTNFSVTGGKPAECRVYRAR